MSFFGEQVLPGVVSHIDATGLTTQGQLAYGAIGIVGLAAAGTEDYVKYFTSSSEAKLYLQGGAALDAIRAAYAAGAKRVYFVRIGTPVAADKDFAAGVNADSMTFTAKNKGTNGNNIEVAIAVGGGGAGYRTVTIRQIDSYNNIVEVFDNGGDGWNDKDDIVTAINATDGTGSRIVTASADVTVDVPDAATYTALAGGSDGSLSAQEVSDGLDLLLNYPVDIVLVDDSATTYHAIVAAHCEEASNSIYKSERTGVVGMDQGTTLGQYTAQASTLNNKRVVLVAPNIYVPDWNSNIAQSVLTDGHVVAGMVAGLKAGQNDPAEPLTFKGLKYCTGLEIEFSLSELEQLIEGHVLPVGLHRGGYRVIKQVTTSADGAWEEWSVVTSCDYIMKDLREYLEGLFIGRKGTASILSLIEASVKGRLTLYVSQEILYAYFKDSVTANFLPGDQTFITVTFSAVPIMPVNNIGIAATISSVYNFQLALQFQGRAA